MRWDSQHTLTANQIIKLAKSIAKMLPKYTIESRKSMIKIFGVYSSRAIVKDLKTAMPNKRTHGKSRAIQYDQECVLGLFGMQPMNEGGSAMAGRNHTPVSEDSSGLGQADVSYLPRPDPSPRILQRCVRT